MNESNQQKSTSPVNTRARSDESKALRRSEILNVALDAFFEKGFKATRLDDIAKGAGMTKGALYLYFDSKESLFVGLIEEMAQPKLEGMKQLLNTTDSASDAMLKIMSKFASHLNGSQLPKLMKILIADSGAFPDMVTLYRESLIKKGLALIESILQQGKDSGEFYIDAPHLVAKLVIAPMIFTAIWKTVFEKTDNQILDAKKLLETHIQIFLNGIKHPLEQSHE
ncbi:TetR/AcrR family transcriptional regulator [Marinicellulosiphila megalodicopiae]|uniref:TetR/AcrR family transcriptional regulator n=1 Tax=Marinicellulosiphila megalodicopiae TaxID=2724896 RepID=UPI003BB1F6C4